MNRTADVLTVPVLAVLAIQRQGPRHQEGRTTGSCRPKSSWALSNEKYVEVMKGLKEGDVVAMSPMSLMTDEEKRKAFGSAAQGRPAGTGARMETAEADAKARRRWSRREP